MKLHVRLGAPWCGLVNIGLDPVNDDGLSHAALGVLVRLCAAAHHGAVDVEVAPEEEPLVAELRARGYLSDDGELRTWGQGKRWRR